MNCTHRPLVPPKVVAIAKDRYLTPKIIFPDPANLPGSFPIYGQDITSGINRPAPGKQSVGTTEAELKPKMQKLLSIFAGGDRTGMGQRLFAAFLRKQSKPTYFGDAALNAAAARHQNIKQFCNSALSAPNSPHNNPGKLRIHQTLKNAGWDINKILVPTDLGVPAFNIGSKLFSTDDFDNGLGLMINGVQYAFAVATHYQHDQGAARYSIRLKFLFYDVFGLDDGDLKEFGATSDSRLTFGSAVGITAWWQLQHQFGYAPLVTRIVIEAAYEVPET